MIRRGNAFAIGLVIGCAFFACTQFPKPVSEIQATIDSARRNGALRCAPRELALAESHLEFAKLEYSNGFSDRASEHLAIALPNAVAAFDLSPKDFCTDKPSDRDGDGIPDIVDKCPDVPENFNGFQDEDGCPDDPDSDGDGIPDSIDQCPNLPEDFDGFQDNDGCPDPDNDMDGIADVVDKCPNDPEDVDNFEDEDGCPDPDNDKDGVLDVDDWCPLDPGPADNHGCPRKNALVVVTTSQIKITQQIHFEFNKSIVKKDSFPILDAVTQVLKDNASIKIEVGGHTDNVGNPDYNKKLSQARAESVRKYLVDHGVSDSRLTAKGYGMDVPIDTNSTDAGRAKNRRVEFVRTESH